MYLGESAMSGPLGPHGTPFFGKLNIQNCAMLQGSQYKGMLQSCLEIPAVKKMTRPQWPDVRWSKFTSEEQFL